MKTDDITDPIFLQAVNALDAGRLDELRELVANNPRLLRDPLLTPGESGYFKDPYLIWFVADNPIRNAKLPSNIVDALRFLIDAVKREAPDTYLNQINYTLGLVATGRIPREYGVQIPMMEVLVDAGAVPGDGMGAIAHGNPEAARWLIDHGGELTLATALLLNYKNDIEPLTINADKPAKLTALTAAAFYGNAAIVKYLINTGLDPNGYPDIHSGFHSHGTPLHQAVSSASLDTVRLLVNAGAQLDVTDKIYDGTPLDWASHMYAEAGSETEKAAYAAIEDYLKGKL